MNKNYEKDLDNLKEQIFKESNVLVTKRALLERFCEIDKEYNGRPWNLLQILANINILIEEEPCEDCISRQAVAGFLKNHANDFEDVKVRMAFKAASSLVENADNIPPVTPTREKGKWVNDPYEDFLPHCSNCKTKWSHAVNMKYCPNCGAEMESEE